MTPQSRLKICVYFSPKREPNHIYWKNKGHKNIFIVKDLINSAHFAVYIFSIFCPMVHTTLDLEASAHRGKLNYFRIIQ